MSVSEVIISVDIGTTSTKVLAIDGGSGRILHQCAREYPLYTPRPGYAEQHPDEIFNAVVEAVSELTGLARIEACQVSAVSFSSAMHSIFIVDRDGHPLTPCITWADQRSAEYAQQLNAQPAGLDIYKATGTPIHPMSPLPKIKWLLDREPSVAAKAHKFIGIKEYVFYRLFGKFVVDVSIASATGCLNLKRFDWHAPALEWAGISKDKLSDPVPCTQVLSGMDEALAGRMGLSPNTPFVVGASDGVLANLGAGAVEPGQFAVSIGTSGAIRGVADRPVTDSRGRLFCYALDETFWVIGGSINNGGIVLRWVRDHLATAESEAARKKGRDPYDYLAELAAEVQPGSAGLMFMPLLTGERAPYWDANARGVFFGLSLIHEKKHMIRAAMEGVMFQIGSVASILEGLVGPASEIRASGGFARSALWRQMLCDITGRPVAIPDSIESSGLGAAMVGKSAVSGTPVNMLRDWSGQILHRHAPNPDHLPLYREMSELYDRLYHQLSDSFPVISKLQHSSSGEK